MESVRCLPHQVPRRRRIDADGPEETVLDAHGGFLYAYQGLNQDGPVFKLLLNGGLYRYRSGATEITGRQLMGAALPGWRWNRPGLEVTVFAGLDVQDHRYRPDDPGNRLRGTHLGVRGGFDVWYEPLRDGMVTASASGGRSSPSA